MPWVLDSLIQTLKLDFVVMTSLLQELSQEI